MALEFERNTNLEEIDSDALFGITYLAHQTVSQKVIFFGCVTIATVVFIGSQFLFDVPFIIALFIEILFGAIGFLFGANQCEYLSIAQYLKLIFFKPVKYAKFASSEDIGLMKEAVERERVNALKLEKEQVEATEEGQRRMLMMVIFIIIGALIFVFVLKGIGAYKANKIEHHTVGCVMVNEDINI